MQLKVSAALIQVTVSAANMWVTIFIVIIRLGVSVAFMQVAFPAEHYSYVGFYFNYADDCFCHSSASESFKQQFYIPFYGTYVMQNWPQNI